MMSTRQPMSQRLAPVGAITNSSTPTDMVATETIRIDLKRPILLTRSPEITEAKVSPPINGSMARPEAVGAAPSPSCM